MAVVFHTAHNLAPNVFIMMTRRGSKQYGSEEELVIALLIKIKSCELV